MKVKQMADQLFGLKVQYIHALACLLNGDEITDFL